MRCRVSTQPATLGSVPHSPEKRCSLRLNFLHRRATLPTCDVLLLQRIISPSTECQDVADEDLQVNDGNSWRRHLRSGLIILGPVMLALLIYRIGWQQLWTVLLQAKLSYVLLALVAGIVSSVLRALRFGTMFPPAAGWWRFYGCFAVMRSLNITMPFKTGEIASLALLKKYGHVPNIAEAAPAWLLIRICDVAALAIWLSVALAFQPLGSQFQSARWLIVTAIVAAVFVCMVMSVWARRRNDSGHGENGGWLRKRLSDFQKGIQRTQSPATILTVLGSSVLIWGVLAFGAVCAQRAFDIPLTVTQCFLAAIGALTISVLPVHAPAGIGTGEAVWTVMFLALGVPEAVAISSSIAVRIVPLSSIVIEYCVGCLLLMPGAPDKHGVAASQCAGNGKA